MSELNRAVEAFMRRGLVTLPSDASVVDGAKRMKESSVGSVVVTEAGTPVGIVTERDLLNKVLAEGKNSSKTKLKEIMSSPLVYVSPKTTVKEALSTMVKHGFRRLLVKDGERFVGMISQRAYVGDRASASVPLVELERPKGVVCPYCGVQLPSSKTLSEHLDEHIRQEVLEEKREEIKVKRRRERHDL